MPILAFLKTIPTKDLIYGALIAVLLGAFGWYTVHERDVGKAAIIAADARATAKLVAKDKAIQDAVQAASNNNGIIYEKAIAIPAVADLGVSCVRNAPRSGGSVPQTADNRPGDTQAPVSGVTAPFDPSGAALTVGRNADAQINALIDTINMLVAEMKTTP